MNFLFKIWNSLKEMKEQQDRADKFLDSEIERKSKIIFNNMLELEGIEYADLYRRIDNFSPAKAYTEDETIPTENLEYSLYVDLEISGHTNCQCGEGALHYAIHLPELKSKEVDKG
jgi:hypothetical protein